MVEREGWPTRLGNQQRTGKSSEALAPPLALSWRREFPGNYLWSGAAVARDVVYYSCGSGLYALNIEDGTLRWHVPSVIVHGAGAPTICGDVLLAAGFFHVHAIDIKSGRLLWQRKSEKLISGCSPAVLEGTLFWGDAAGVLHATSVATSALQWEFHAGSGWVHFSPSVLVDTLYFGTERGTVYALEAASGRPKWRQQLAGAMSATNSAALGNGKLFVAVEGAGLFALDATTGNIIWHYAIAHGPRTAPTVADGMIYVGSQQLYALSEDTGEVVWISSPRSLLWHSAPVIAGDHIFVGGGNENCVYAFDRATGDEVWEYKTGGVVYSTPAIASGRLVVGCHDGFLYCFEAATRWTQRPATND